LASIPNWLFISARKLRGVPLVGMLLAGAESFDEFARDIFRRFQERIALIFSFGGGATDAVNRLALLVSLLVILEQVVCGRRNFELRRTLRVFDAAGDSLDSMGTLRHAEAVHQGFDALAARCA